MTTDTRLVAILAAAMLLAAACRATEPPPPPKDVVVWKEVGSWSGRGDAQTEHLHQRSRRVPRALGR